jgi:hypothetical protein
MSSSAGWAKMALGAWFYSGCMSFDNFLSSKIYLRNKNYIKL